MVHTKLNELIMSDIWDADDKILQVVYDMIKAEMNRRDKERSRFKR